MYDNRLYGFARDEIQIRPAITYEGRSRSWPLQILGTATLFGLFALAGILVMCLGG